MNVSHVVFYTFQKNTTNQSLQGLMMGEDQGGFSLGLPEKAPRLGLVLERRPGPGTCTSASPETDWHL